MDGFEQQKLDEFNLDKIYEHDTIDTIAKLMEYTTKGKLIKKEFERDKRLNTRLICDLVINYEFDRTQNYRITTERFVQLSMELAEIFSTPETYETVKKQFYYPFQRSTAGRKSINCGGSLYDRYVKYRSELIAKGLISKSKSYKKEIRAKKDSPLEIPIIENQSEKDILRAWSASFKSREPCTNIQQYFATYKCLSFSFGHLFLCSDFDVSNPASANNLIEKWPIIAAAISKYAEKKNKLIFIDRRDQMEQNNDLVFTYLVPILGVLLRNKRKNGEPLTKLFGTDIKDVKDSFILVVKTIEELNSYKAKRLRGDTKITFGPFIAVIGQLSSKDKQVFVIINDHNYEIKSKTLLDAVNTCYKMFFTLNIDFPVECRHVWSFFQSYIFKNDLNTVKNYIVVLKFMEELDKIIRESQI